MFTTTYTDVLSGKNVTPAFPQYAAVALTDNIQLSWPAQFQNTNTVVAVIMDITPDAGGRTVTMPDAREVGTGFSFTINNPGNFSFNLLDNQGNIIVAIPNATARIIWLISNATQGGLWRNLPGSAGGGAVTSVDAISRIGATVNPDPNLVITGTPALPITGIGTIKFVLGADLAALTSFAAATGFSTRTAANTWALRTILGTANQVAVDNGDGVAGNPTISLVPDIRGITSLTVGNLSLGAVGAATANTIASTNANGDIIFNPNGTGSATVAASKTLKLMAENNVNYMTIRSGASVVNQNFIWPTAAPIATQVLGFSGGSTLSWLNIPTAPGASTVNAIARFSNTVGGIKDSLSNLDDTGKLSVTSFSTSDISIGVFDSQSIATLNTNENLNIVPNGTGALVVLGDLWIIPSSGSQRKLRLYNAANTFFAGLISNAGMVANYTWSLPVAGGTAGIFTTDVANSMSITPFTSYFPAASTINAVPRYSNITGYPLKDSLFVISDIGAGTGLISCTIGNLSLSTVANTISSSASLALTSSTAFTLTSGTTLALSSGTTLSLTSGGTSSTTISTNSSGNVSLSPGTGGVVTCVSDLQVLPKAGVLTTLKLYNAAGTQFAGLQATSAAATSVTFTLPAAAPATLGILKSSSSGVITVDALGAVAGPLRSDAAGVVSVNNITTAANHIARYSDAVGTLQDSGCYIDSSNNMSLGTGTVSTGTGASSTIVLAAGTVASGAGAGFLCIGNRSTGTGNVLALYGASDGGISASVVNTVTNKISIYVNGTRYYLLASTSSA